MELVNLYYESLLTEYVVPNFELKIKEYRVPNDDYYSNQWALPRINVPLAWDITTGNNDIVIAIIDEGVDFSQKDLDDKLIPGIDVTNQGDNSPQPYDWDARGTACAGIAGAETDNNQGIAGVAWNCKIMPIQIAYEPYEGADYWITTSDWIVSGIDWAVNNGADVLSNNWGGGPPDDDVHNALINAVANGRNGKGRIVAFSSGNYYADASSSVRYPAKYPEVIAVGAVNENDERCSIGNTEYWGSCYGPGLDVTAPGIHIFVTDINGEGGYSINDYYGDFGGTSAACPHVAGLAALILSNNPNLTWQQVKKTICLSADRVPGMRGQSFTDEYGYGRINANKALRNLYVPQVYHTIASALSIAIDGQAIVVSGSHVLSSNLTVPAGVTLQFKSGSSVSLNGYSIVSVGGAITIENGININPDVRLMTGSSIKGLYPSIGLAVQEASNGDRVVASGVSKTCEDDLGVPGGMTLELEGCNMEFDSGVWLKVLGALKADNSTFTRPGGSSNWKGIRFYDSAVDSSCVIENSTISYADYGVYTFLSNPRIRNNTITNCTYGVYLNRSVASVTGNEISSCVRGVYGYRANCAKIVNNLITTGTSSISGLRFYDSEPEVYNNTIQGTFTYLLDADHYSRPTAIGPESQDYQGYNRMIGGSGATIYAHDHSEVVFGSGFIESTEGYAGYNTIYLDIQTDRIANVRAESYSSVVAQYNWWGAYPPEGFFADGTSSIDHRDPLRSDPGGGSNLGKPAGNLLAGALNVNTYASTGKDILRVLLSEADWYWQNLCYRKAMERYKTALQNYPDSPCAPMMLLRVAFAWRSLKEKGLEEFLSQFVRSGNKVLSTEAMELLIGENIRHGEIKKAIERAEYVISDNPGTEAEYKALFTLFNLYLNDLEDREKAEEILARMKMKYPDYPLTQMAQFDVGEPVEWKFPKPGEFGESPGVAGISPSSYWLGEGHPNPFNPTITIDFYLPEEAFVTLSIYDMLGREVRRLIDSRLGPGYNRVTWDGHGDSGEALPNGVYICVFRSGGFKACRKMILLK